MQATQTLLSPLPQPASEVQRSPINCENPTHKLYPVRQDLLQHMNHAMRAAWRQVNRQARADVCEAIRSLAYNPKARPSSQRSSASGQAQGPSQLPRSLLASCTGLTSLSCKDMPSLRSIQGLPESLEVLRLDNCHNVADFTPLLACTALRELTVHGGHIAALAGMVGGLTSLQALTLSDHQAVKQRRLEVGPALVKSLSTLRGLHQLHLLQLRLYAPRSAPLAPALAALTNLRHLSIRDCILGPKGTVFLAGALPALSQLRQLDLQSISFQSGGAKALASSLEALPHLEGLNLTGIQCGDVGVQKLASAIASLASLASLHLANNHIGPDGMHALAPALIALGTHLETLDLSGNPLLERGAHALEPAIRALTALSSLHINGTQLGCVGAYLLQLAVDAVPGLLVEGPSDNEIGSYDEYEGYDYEGYFDVFEGYDSEGYSDVFDGYD